MALMEVNFFSKALMRPVTMNVILPVDKVFFGEETEEEKKADDRSFVNGLARFFSYILLGIAAITAFYWYKHDVTRIWPAITSIFIIACPCALLLANSFTAGHFLRIFSRKNIYLRNSSVIDEILRNLNVIWENSPFYLLKNRVLESAVKYTIKNG